jgi:CHASE1-domain containing sensor protein
MQWQHTHHVNESLTLVGDEQEQVLFPGLLAICPLWREIESSSSSPTLAVKVRSLVGPDSVYRTIRRRTSIAFEQEFVAKAKNNILEMQR